MGIDRSLDEEGIPDLEGPLPEKAATGDPQEGASPPTDRPASLDYGTTAEEQSRPEPLDVRLARELPDDEPLGAEPEAGVILAPEDEALGIEDDEKDVVGRATDDDLGGLSAEEAAVHVVDEP
jgi:hypothetical protein